MFSWFHSAEEAVLGEVEEAVAHFQKLKEKLFNLARIHVEKAEELKQKANQHLLESETAHRIAKKIEEIVS